jgi:outer membrane protein
LFSGGLINGRVAEARAGARGAQSGVEGARAQVREAVICAWEDVQTSHALVEAAADQATAATSALDSVRNEVRVGQKPALDLINAEREALAAESAVVAARGGAIVAAYRMNVLLHGD